LPSLGGGIDGGRGKTYQQNNSKEFSVHDLPPVRKNINRVSKNDLQRL
jgi:hypothetical protein